ncbi:GcrA family cell cycle regulator [Aquabacter spiritensis]|uniref:GcrA cell cycle regulator n=1 Tax=Aquabacter spiritensis TaxID=933073 RepID=A0A4R3MA34_9HYPH|nr:GcrA family cell cycle regulator [Aquabacter spiritensis]TCT08255.1 GcrA cell cycle regulator [Aquabacter spiritensis]
MSWNDERVELLKRLWGEGLSASQIATELGGITRNAVIGKVHRLGLSGRVKAAGPARPRKAQTEAPAPRPASRPAFSGNTALAQALEPVVEQAPRPAPVAGNVVPMGQRCTIMNLTEATCRWPVGEPGTESFYFCGGRTVSGLPYCTHHARMAYQPSQDRRRDRRLAGIR